MQLLDHPLPIARLVEVRAGIDVFHNEAHYVVEQNDNLARGGGDRLGLADSRPQPAVEGPKSGICFADRDSRHPQYPRDPVGGLAGVRRENLAAADLAARGKRQP